MVVFQSRFVMTVNDFGVRLGPVETHISKSNRVESWTITNVLIVLLIVQSK